MPAHTLWLAGALQEVWMAEQYFNVDITWHEFIQQHGVKNTMRRRAKREASAPNRKFLFLTAARLSSVCGHDTVNTTLNTTTQILLINSYYQNIE